MAARLRHAAFALAACLVSVCLGLAAAPAAQGASGRADTHFATTPTDVLLASGAGGAGGASEDAQGAEAGEESAEAEPDWEKALDLLGLQEDAPLSVGDTFVGASDEGIDMVFCVTGPNTVSVGGSVVIDHGTWEEVVQAHTIDYSYTGVISIPERVRYQGQCFNVTGVRDDAFASYYERTTKVTCSVSGVRIPESVVEIGRRSFYDCPRLSTVSFEGESGLVSIGAAAFASSGLSSIDLPASLTTLGSSAFEDARGLANVRFLGDNVQVISERCFAYTGLRTLDFLPGSVNTLGAYSFRGSALASAVVPAHISRMGTGVFRECRSLERSTFAEGCPITEIPAETFMECTGLLGYEFVPWVNSIELDSFRDSGLRSADIPVTLTYLGEGAFRECEWLTQVNFAEGHGLLGLSASALRDCTHLPSLELPDSVRTLDANALSGCTALASFTMPADLEELGAFALSDCTALSEIKFQTDARYVTSTSSTFYHDNALTSVVFYDKRNDSLMFPSSQPTIYCTVSYYASKAAVGVKAESRFVVADGAVPANASGKQVFEGSYRAAPAANSMWAVEPGFSLTKGMEDSFYAYAADVSGELAVGDRFTADTIERCTVTYTVEELPEGTSPGRATVGWGNALLPEQAIDANQTGAVTLPERVVAPDGRTYVVDAISPYAFSGCSRFVTVTIPATVASIGERAFARAAMLRNVYFDGDASKMFDKGLFLGCANIKLVVFGSKKANVVFGISDPDVYYTVRYYKSRTDKDTFRLQAAVVVHEKARLGSLRASDIYMGAVPKLAVGYEWDYEPGFGADVPLADSCWVYAAGIGFQADILVRGGNVSRTPCWFKVIEEAGADGSMGTVQVGVGRDGLTAVHTSVSGTPVIPATVTDPDGNVYRVVEVGSYAFGSEDYAQSCAYVTSVALSTSIERIAENAFVNMPELSSITVPAGVSSMGARAFAGCEKLTRVSFASGSALTKLPESVFEGDWRLATVTLPTKLNEIGKRAFADCYKRIGTTDYGLAAITLPASLTVVGDEAFLGCGKLGSISLPANIRHVGASAYRNCSQVSTLRFNGDAQDVTFGAGAFSLNSFEQLKNVVFMGKKSTTYDSYLDVTGYNVYYNVRYYENNAAFSAGRMLANLLILEDVAAVNWEETRLSNDGERSVPCALSGSMPSLGEGSTWRCESGFSVDKRTDDSYYAVGGYDISFATATLDQTDFFYSGAAIKPVPTVTWLTGQALVEGVDWELDTSKGLSKDGYGNNRRGPVGIVYIRGIGDYAGSLRALFNISLQVDSANSFTASFDDDDSFVYDGTPHTPAVSVSATLLGDPYNALRGRDYTVEYSDNVDAGTGHVVVRGRGLFGGVFRYPFTIRSADLRTCTVSVSGAELVGGEVNAEVSVRSPWGTSLVEGRDFSVESVLDTGGNSATIYITGLGNWTGVLQRYVGDDDPPPPDPDPDDEQGQPADDDKGGTDGGTGGGKGTDDGPGEGDGGGSGKGEGTGKGGGRGGDDSPRDGKKSGSNTTPAANTNKPTGPRKAQDVAAVADQPETEPMGGTPGGGTVDARLEVPKPEFEPEPEPEPVVEPSVEQARRLPKIFEMDEVPEEVVEVLNMALTVVQVVALVILVAGALIAGLVKRSYQYGKEK